jgi:hypothetical protein
VHIYPAAGIVRYGPAVHRKGTVGAHIYPAGISFGGIV